MLAPPGEEVEEEMLEQFGDIEAPKSGKLEVNPLDFTYS